METAARVAQSAGFGLCEGKAVTVGFCQEEAETCFGIEAADGCGQLHGQTEAEALERTI